MQYILLIISIFLTSCSIKEYTLFQNKDPSLEKPIELNITFKSKIQPDDVLSIDIYNMNQKSNILKDSNLLNQGRTDATQNKYIVESDGTIYLPLIKEVKVEGLTSKELSKFLTKKYAKYLRDPYVKAQITNHRVYVFGEVAKQGIVPITGNNISLIEVLSKSGGLTNDAVLDKIRIISPINGKNILRTVNLKKLSTLNASNLMLGNNSIVYVEPKNSKAYKLGIDNYLPIINAIGGIAGDILNIDRITKTGNLFNLQ
jgi:polysaccharide export outer membrane protein